MVDNLTLEDDVLKSIRKVLSAQAIQAIEDAPKIYVSPDADAMKYGYIDEHGKSLKPPKKASVYVFYSRWTDRPVYVGESEHLKRQLDHEIRPTGITEFKTRWLRDWLDLSHRLTAHDQALIAHFIAQNLYLKYLVLYFGRTEICTDLTLDFKLRVGPNAVDFAKEFPDWNHP